MIIKKLVLGIFCFVAFCVPAFAEYTLSTDEDVRLVDRVSDVIKKMPTRQQPKLMNALEKMQSKQKPETRIFAILKAIRMKLLGYILVPASQGWVSKFYVYSLADLQIQQNEISLPDVISWQIDGYLMFNIQGYVYVLGQSTDNNEYDVYRISQGGTVEPRLNLGSDVDGNRAIFDQEKHLMITQKNNNRDDWKSTFLIYDLKNPENKPTLYEYDNKSFDVPVNFGQKGARGILSIANGIADILFDNLETDGLTSMAEVLTIDLLQQKIIKKVSLKEYEAASIKNKRIHHEFGRCLDGCLVYIDTIPYKLNAFSKYRDYEIKSFVNKNLVLGYIGQSFEFIPVQDIIVDYQQ